MQRRTFLAAAALTIPALSSAQSPENSNQRKKEGFVVKAKESRFKESTVLFDGTSPNDIKVSGKDTDGQLTIFEYTGNVKGGPPLHVHEKQDEIFFIVEGSYTFKVGGAVYYLQQGDTIFLPRKIAHAFAQTSEKGKMFFMFLPSGKMEDFFRRSATFKGQPSPAEAARLFSDHEMTIVGPPLEF